MRQTLFLLFILCFTLSLQGQSTDSKEEFRAKDLERSLMAPCCWGGTVAEHSSPESSQIRQQIRSEIAAGKTDEQILDQMVAQYSERVLAAPTRKGFNRVAWILPSILFLLGAVLVYLYLKSDRRRSTHTAQTFATSSDLTEEDRKKYLSRLDEEIYGS